MWFLSSPLNPSSYAYSPASPLHSSDLSDAEKLHYINAVRCLMTKPSITPPEVVPGARTRYDDFVATHMNLTQTIHMTGNFLSWHR